MRVQNLYQKIKYSRRVNTLRPHSGTLFRLICCERKNTVTAEKTDYKRSEQGLKFSHAYLPLISITNPNMVIIGKGYMRNLSYYIIYHKITCIPYISGRKEYLKLKYCGQDE